MIAAREVLPVQQLTHDEERQGVSDLQTQIDRLSLTLQQWRQTQEHLLPTEQRLAQLTEQCDEIVARWTETGQRHSRAVGELEARLTDWNAIEARLQHDASQRLRELEQTIKHEWEALREIHGEPARQLREQAASLGETCLAAAHSALSGFERAEARIAALEADLQRRMNQLSADLHSAVAELRAANERRQPALPAAVAPFELDSVMRIHEGLRERDAAARSLPPAAPVDSTAKQEPAISERLESLERAVTTEKEGMRRTSRVALAVLALAIAGAIVGGVALQRRVDARLNEAASRVAAAEQQAAVTADLASKRVAETRQQADQQIQDARQTAQRAQVIGAVLAAPDLVRQNLVGGDRAPRASAQFLWSRSRGMVFSASRLPAPPRGTTYTLWLLTNTEPVRAGVLTPDSAGRVTFATDTPPAVPRRVTGVSVTAESSSTRRTPSGAAILAQAQ
jgi:hypothetical protein